MSDKEYVAYMEALNDDLWRSEEKWCYYDCENENLILPTAVGCFILFFVDHPAVTILMIILLIMFVLYLCHLKNVKLGQSPRVIEKRKEHREYRRKYLGMKV